MFIFTGLGVAICTPFDEKNVFEPESYKKHIDFLLDNGTDAIISCGTTGESPTLTSEEREEVVKTAVKVAKSHTKKAPVIAGAGGNDARAIIKSGQSFARIGADALMITAPYYNKTSQRGLIEHFSHIAANVDLPILLYNVPSRVSMDISPKTLETLCKIKNISAIKEASGNITQISEVIERCGDDLWVYSGNDGDLLPVLSIGGRGVVSTAGNIAPNLMRDIIAKYLENNIEAARRSQHYIGALVRELFSDVNPMPVKRALNLMGFKAGKCRLPLVDLDETAEKRLHKILENYKLI